MNHVPENILTQLAANEAGEQDREPATDDVRQHLAACPTCRRRLDEYRQLWSLMGQWSVEMPPSAEFELPDLPPRQVAPGGQHTGVLTRLGPLRAAAAVLFAAGLGLTAAVTTDPGPSPIDRQTVAETSLVLPQFQNASPGMFAQSILGFGHHAKESSEDATQH